MKRLLLIAAVALGFSTQAQIELTTRPLTDIQGVINIGAELPIVGSTSSIMTDIGYGNVNTLNIWTDGSDLYAGSAMLGYRFYKNPERTGLFLSARTRFKSFRQVYSKTDQYSYTGYNAVFTFGGKWEFTEDLLFSAEVGGGRQFIDGVGTVLPTYALTIHYRL